MKRKRHGVQTRSRLPKRTAHETPAGARPDDGTGRRLRNAALLFIAGLALFSIRLDAAKGFVFDEHSYIPAANGYATGVNLEPSHPPLAKLILAGGIQALGDNPWGWRIASAVAGALILVLVYILTWKLSHEILAAVAATLFSAVNGLLFVLARAGMLDAIAVMFLLAGLLCVFAIVRGELSVRWGGALAGCAFGLCMACKWMALIPMAACWVALWTFRKRAAIPAMIAPFIAVYVASFVALAGVLHLSPSWSWFWAQQAGIFAGHESYSGRAIFESRWWTWPLKDPVHGPLYRRLWRRFLCIVPGKPSSDVAGFCRTVGARVSRLAVPRWSGRDSMCRLCGPLRPVRGDAH